MREEGRREIGDDKRLASRIRSVILEQWVLIWRLIVLLLLVYVQVLLFPLGIHSSDDDELSLDTVIDQYQWCDDVEPSHSSYTCEYGP